MHREPVKSSENNSNPFLLSNIELDYESMEKAEIKFMVRQAHHPERSRRIDDYLKDLEEGDRK